MSSLEIVTVIYIRICKQAHTKFNIDFLGQLSIVKFWKWYVELIDNGHLQGMYYIMFYNVTV